MKDVAKISILPMHAFLLAGGICFTLAWPMSILTRRLERHMRRGLGFEMDRDAAARAAAEYRRRK